MTNPKCKLDGCENPAKKRGWCPTHYERWRRRGTVELTRHPRPDECTIDGCDSAVVAKGLCTKHYQRMAIHGSLDKPAPRGPRYKDIDRFIQDRIKVNGSCWEWTAGLTPRGYARIGVTFDGMKFHRAHRLSYHYYVGPFDPSLEIDHICHNAACVNPDHLRPATRAQNAENRKGPAGRNTSGFRGVAWNSASQKWQAVVFSHGTMYHGGLFDDPAEAAVAARELRKKHHEFLSIFDK